jgi:hypothetical protein
MEPTRIPSAVELGLLTVSVWGTTPNRRARIRARNGYELWRETDVTTDVIRIGDGVFEFERRLQADEL